MARLLEKVSFACRNSEKVKDLSGNDIEVRPTFTFNPESKTSPTTAKRWVEANWYGRNKGVFEPITELNSGLVLKITNLEVRSEGGRAYKVIDQFNRQHDLREDQLLECIKREGIAPGGKLGGQFVWGVDGSTLRLTLVGGDSYAKMVQGSIDASATASWNPLTLKTMIPGTVCQKRDGTKLVFLGRAKFPHLNGTLHAFVELPAPPDRYDPEVAANNGSDPSFVKRNNDVADAWDSMSWEARYDYVELDQYVRYDRPDKEYHRFYKPVIFLSSPKFVAAGEVLKDFPASLFMNANDPRSYVTGNQDDLRNFYLDNSLGPQYNATWNCYGHNGRNVAMERERLQKLINEDHAKALKAAKEAVTWLLTMVLWKARSSQLNASRR